MRTSALTIVFALFVLAPSVASAQSFAGGSIGAGPAPNPVGTTELGFRVESGRVTVRGVVLMRCRGGEKSEAEGTGSGSVNADGTFRVTFNRRQLQPGRSRGYRRTVVVSGQVRGQEIVGRVEATATGGQVRGCQGAFDYLARTAPALPADAAPPPANGTLIGMNSSRGGPFAVNLRVSADATRITQFVTGARYTCRRLRPYHETNYSPPIRINPDGTFRFVERFRTNYRNAVERITVITEGRFVNGGAVGTWQAQTRARSKRTKRIIDRCDTGKLTWSAGVA